MNDHHHIITIIAIFIPQEVAALPTTSSRRSSDDGRDFLLQSDETKYSGGSIYQHHERHATPAAANHADGQRLSKVPSYDMAFGQDLVIVVPNTPVSPRNLESPLNAAFERVSETSVPSGMRPQSTLKHSDRSEPSFKQTLLRRDSGIDREGQSKIPTFNIPSMKRGLTTADKEKFLPQKRDRPLDDTTGGDITAGGGAGAGESIRRNLAHERGLSKAMDPKQTPEARPGSLFPTTQIFSSNSRPRAGPSSNSSGSSTTTSGAVMPKAALLITPSSGFTALASSQTGDGQTQQHAQELDSAVFRLTSVFAPVSRTVANIATPLPSQAAVKNKKGPVPAAGTPQDKSMELDGLLEQLSVGLRSIEEPVDKTRQQLDAQHFALVHGASE